MAVDQDWEFPRDLQPKAAELAFDLEPVLASVVGLRAEAPEDAFTAQVLLIPN